MESHWEKCPLKSPGVFQFSKIFLILLSNLTFIWIFSAWHTWKENWKNRFHVTHFGNFDITEHEEKFYRFRVLQASHAFRPRDETFSSGWKELFSDRDTNTHTRAGSFIFCFGRSVYRVARRGLVLKVLWEPCGEQRDERSKPHHPSSSIHLRKSFSPAMPAEIEDEKLYIYIFPFLFFSTMHIKSHP